MESPEKQKPLSEVLSELCPKKEHHAECLNRPCPECGHINAVPGSAEYKDALSRGIKEQTEKEEGSQVLKDD